MFRSLSQVMVAAFACLLLGRATDLAAQTGTKGKKTVRPAQAVESELEAPPVRPKRRPAPRSDPAGETEEAQPGSRLPRPQGAPLRVEKLSPELEQILQDWETHSSRFKKVTGEFKRYKYDYTFEIELQADGKFAYEAPDKGAYELQGSKLAANAASRKKNAKGSPFELKSDNHERWICTGTEIVRIDEQEKTYERAPIPTELQGQNIIDGPLPFLFGMKAEQAKKRYSFELLESKAPYENGIWLKVLPRELADAQNWSQARVIIDRKTYLPLAVMLTDPGETSETVHRFRNIDVNGGADPLGFFKRDPFKPDLRKYKLVQNNIPERPAGKTPSVPGVSTRPAGPGQARGTATLNDRDLPRSADVSNGAGKKATKTPRK